MSAINMLLVASQPIHCVCLASVPIPAAIPAAIEDPIIAPALSLGTKTVLFPNAWTRSTSMRLDSISRANGSTTSESALDLMRMALASASAVRRMASDCASASIFVRSACAFAAATIA